MCTCAGKAFNTCHRPLQRASCLRAVRLWQSLNRAGLCKDCLKIPGSGIIMPGVVLR